MDPGTAPSIPQKQTAEGQLQNVTLCNIMEKSHLRQK
jgi:hypothetical protein